MPLDLGDVLANRSHLSVRWKDARVQLAYDPVKYTTAADAQWRRAQADEQKRVEAEPDGPIALQYIDFMLLDLVAEWDLEAHTDECRDLMRANGEPCRREDHKFRVSPETMRLLPLPLKVAIGRAIEQDLVPNDAASSAGSSPAAGGAPSRNGPASFVQPGIDRKSVV